jgi:Flp pilus assembly pilin Flp
MIWTQIRAELPRLWRDRSATTAIEYALIAAIVVLALVSLQYTIGSSIVSFFFQAASGL